MLASINPFGERARNQSYRITVVAYIAGSTAAGAVLGGALGVAGAALTSSAISPAVALAVAGGLAALGLAFDARLFGTRVPGPRRQVDENWLANYRGWVYGAGFGAQLGAAFVTIVTASATWVAFACALPILAAARVRDPAALRRVFRVLDRVRPRVARTTTAIQGASALGLVVLAVVRAA